MRTTAMWAAGMCWVMSAGCSTSPPADTAVAPSDSATTAADLSRASCARRSKGVGLVKEGPVRQGSAVALARDAGKLVAIVADKDAKRLSVVDLDAGSVTGSVEVGGAPEQVLLLGDGRVVATIADASHIEVLEPTGKADAPLERLCTRAVPAGGFGLAASVDGERLAVTSAFEAALTLFEGEELALKGSASLPRSPRGVLIDDQDKAFVSHVVGANVSVVPLGSITGGAPKTRLIDTRVRAGSQDAENLDSGAAAQRHPGLRPRQRGDPARRRGRRGEVARVWRSAAGTGEAQEPTAEAPRAPQAAHEGAARTPHARPHARRASRGAWARRSEGEQPAHHHPDGQRRPG